MTHTRLGFRASFRDAKTAVGPDRTSGYQGEFPPRASVIPSDFLKAMNRLGVRGPTLPLIFPRISSPFSFLAFLGSPLFSTNQAKVFFFAGVLIPAKLCQSDWKSPDL